MGFTNFSGFNRHFRATTGTTPSRYRWIDQL
jgi:AraC-like DNA-binding protein